VGSVVAELTRLHDEFLFWIQVLLKDPSIVAAGQIPDKPAKSAFTIEKI
jgi:hypothetical protein